MMVGRLVSFPDGYFSGAMLNFQGVFIWLLWPDSHKKALIFVGGVYTYVAELLRAFLPDFWGDIFTSYCKFTGESEI